MEERRTTSNIVRSARLFGGGAGTLIGVICAWGYQEWQGHAMAAEVAAAIGGLASMFLICVSDVKSFILQLFHRGRRR